MYRDRIELPANLPNNGTGGIVIRIVSQPLSLVIFGGQDVFHPYLSIFLILLCGSIVPESFKA
jgi:hypothetical protein